MAHLAGHEAQDLPVLVIDPEEPGSPSESMSPKVLEEPMHGDAPRTLMATHRGADADNLGDVSAVQWRFMVCHVPRSPSIVDKVTENGLIVTHPGSRHSPRGNADQGDLRVGGP
jgi:hypothetical protein